jgi:hypothetical protein
LLTDGQLDVIEQRAYRLGDTIELSAATGMIGQPVQSIEGIRIKTLLNPGIEQSRLVTDLVLIGMKMDRKRWKEII